MGIFNLSHSTTNASYSNEITGSLLSGSPHSALEIVLIVLVAGSLSLVTIIGNILVILSIKVNRNLQTVNNYFLFSLACADLIIGVCSMNLYTLYIVIGHWPLGPVVCDLWLSVDYVVSNASVMNLLIISFDRYFCVTKPLSYPVRRSTRTAGLMIAAAWILSFILWAPAILFWQFIVGGRTVPPGECRIQFFSNATVTFGTAIAAFYLPVAIMTALYWRISKASRSRVRRSCRRTSGTSLGEGPSQSQEDQEERLQHTMLASEHMQAGVGHALEDGAENMHVAHQQNGQTKGEGVETEGPAKGSSASVSVPGSSCNQGEGRSSAASGGPSQTQLFAFKGAKKCGRNPTQNDPKSCQENPVIGPHSLVRMSLFKVKKQTSLVKSKKKGTSSREKKVTRTIMAILVAFVATWTPYNVMVLINTFCSACIPNTLWTIGYWLCYINSTVNPACYALCNITFKNTFKHLLLCQYKNIRSTR